MVPLIIDHNREHFSQAEGTPFTIGSLRLLEHTACCNRANMILAGTFDDPSINEIHLEYISEISIPTPTSQHPYVDCALSVEDVKAGYAAWRENTSTSPHGDHLGIYKVLLKDFDEMVIDEEAASDIQQDAWTITTCIVNLGATFGLTLPRWEETVCVMIEKSPGNLLLHKLRRIFIMANDYNLTLGTIIGRRLLWRAEDLGLIHKDLWGTRQDRSANDAALMKELTFGLARVTNTALATFDNDAKSCYDRVIMTLALIICRQLGLPSSAAAWIGETTKRMKNFVKTGHGISDAWFGNNDGSGKVKHGIGQGHRAAPALWLFVSNFLFHILDKKANGATFFNPHDTLHHRRAADGYVDDVTGFTNLFREEMCGTDITPARLAEAAQADANFWHSLLHFSGGALELDKCFWYAMIPNGKGGFCSKEEVETGGGTITVNTNPPSKIELRDLSDSHKTLGCQKCPLGTQKGSNTSDQNQGLTVRKTTT